MLLHVLSAFNFACQFCVLRDESAVPYLKQTGSMVIVVLLRHEKEG